MAKSNRIDRRILTVAVAFGLALGTSVLALAQPELPELPEEASEQASEAVTNAPARADDEDVSDVEDAEVEDAEVEVEAEGGSAFSEWVRSIPKWGCIRGQLVSHLAQAEHGDDFEGPTYATPEEAAADLEILDRNCAQVAIRKATGAEGEGPGNGNALGHDKKPDHARGRPDGVPSGPPEHAGGDEESLEGE